MLKKFFMNKQKYSIRKYSVGVCSVLIGTVLFAKSVHALDNNDTESSLSQKQNESVINDEANNVTTQQSESDTPQTQLETAPVENEKRDVVEDNTVTVANEKVAFRNAALTQDDMPNLVENGDFSSTKTASKTSKWGGDAAVNWENPWIDPKSNASDGEVKVVNGELLVGSKDDVNKYRAATSQRVVVDSSKTYLFEYDIRSENINGSGARVRLYSQDDNNKNLPNQYDYTEYVNGTTSKHIAKIVMFSPETKKLKIELFLENSTGKAYFDNISLREYVVDNTSTQRDVETGEISVFENKYYLLNRPDLTYVVSDDSVVTAKDGLLIPKKAGKTRVQVYEGTVKMGEFDFNVQKHDDTIYDELRHRWSDISLGNNIYNAQDKKMAAFLQKLESGVEKSLNEWRDPQYKLPTIFADIPFKVSSDLTAAYRRLEQMAQVIENPHSIYYQNSDIAHIVKEGLKWLNQTHYNEQSEITSISDKGNWWDYEIGTPRALLNTLIYMYPYFSQNEIMQYTQPVRKFVPDTTMILVTSKRGPVKAVGGNQTDISKVSILEGILREDSQRIKDGSSALETIMFFVDKGEGFYKDGSFIDHTDVAYTGAYGNVLIEGFSQLLPVIQNSLFALPKDKIAIIDEWIDKAFMPIIVNGELLDMTRGRSISRANAQSHVQAMEVLRSLLRLAQTATPERKQQLLEYVKGQMERDTFFDHYEGTKTYKDIDLLNKLLSDDSIKGYAPSDYIAAFNNMDKFVYYSQTHGFTFALSMYSNKTQNYEYMNKENRQGWYTADGMVYLYNGDLSHYSNDYWATVHPYYLPGTTISNELRSDKKPGMVTLKSDFVGATQLGNTLATIGMDFNNWNNTLTARKSWFVLGDKVVFLTTNIKPQSNLAISTIENRKLTNDSYQFYINDQLVDMTKVVITDKTKSFYMTNGNIKESIGYVFLDELQTYGVIDKRQGSWYDVNEGQSKDIVKNSFATLWSVHNQQPSQLAYVMVPNKSREDVQIAANNVAVLEQTQDLQVVYDKGLNVWGIVKYTDTPYTVDNSVQLSSKGMYIVKKQSDGLYDVSFYNPSAQTSAVKVDSVDDTLQVTLTQQPTHAMPSTVWQVTKKDVAKPMEPQDNDTKPSLKPNESSKVKDNTNKSNQNNLNGSGQLQHKQQITPKASYTGANQQANITLNNASVKNDEAVQAVTGDEQSENMTQQSKRHTNDVTTTQSASSTTTAKQPEKDKTNYLMIGGGSVVAILLALWWFISGEKR